MNECIEAEVKWKKNGLNNYLLLYHWCHVSVPTDLVLLVFVLYITNRNNGIFFRTVEKSKVTVPHPMSRGGQQLKKTFSNDCWISLIGAEVVVLINLHITICQFLIDTMYVFSLYG